MNASTVLVTGGAGFIGSNFVRYLLREVSARIVVLDKLTYAGSRLNLPDDPRVQFIHGDIADRRLIAGLFAEQQPDWVVNFAAESHVDRSIDGPRDFLQTNVVGAFELLETSRHFLNEAPAARESFRFLHVSTDEVYGSLPAAGAFNESTPYAPRSPYSASKAAADHFARAYHATYGLPVLVTNCSNNYGPYQFPEKVIPLMLLNALNAQPLPIYGDGLHVRDWLFVEDHCEGILAVLQRGRVGEKYNLGGDSELTNVELVDRLCGLLDELAPPATNPRMVAQGLATYSALKSFVEDRPGHDRRYAVDTTKIRSELGWRPRHDLASGLRQTVQWYLANAGWCEAILTGSYGRERLGLSAAMASRRRPA